MGLPEDGNAGFVILVLDYQCDFGCWFMVLLICDSVMKRTVVLICGVGVKRKEENDGGGGIALSESGSDGVALWKRSCGGGGSLRSG